MAYEWLSNEIFSFFDEFHSKIYFVIIVVKAEMTLNSSKFIARLECFGQRHSCRFLYVYINEYLYGSNLLQPFMCETVPLPLNLWHKFWKIALFMQY